MITLVFRALDDREMQDFSSKPYLTYILVEYPPVSVPHGRL